MSRIAESDELQAKIGEEISVETMIALGAEEGFDFRAEDFGESDELTDDDLESVVTVFLTNPRSRQKVGTASLMNRPFAGLVSK